MLNSCGTVTQHFYVIAPKYQIQINLVDKQASLRKLKYANKQRLWVRISLNLVSELQLGYVNVTFNTTENSPRGKNIVWISTAGFQTLSDSWERQLSFHTTQTPTNPGVKLNIKPTHQFLIYRFERCDSMLWIQLVKTNQDWCTKVSKAMGNFLLLLHVFIFKNTKHLACIRFPH